MYQSYSKPALSDSYKMVSYEKIGFLTILLTVFRSTTMTMLAKSQGVLRSGYAPENNSAVDYAESAVECQLKCDIDPVCMSFFYSNIVNKCSIHNVSFVDDTALWAEKGWIYLQSMNSKCPPNYIYAKVFNMCYRLHKNESLRIDYVSFKSTCEAEGTEIMKVTSEAFAEHIKDFMVRQTDTLTLFAINGHWNGTAWIFDDNTPITYFRWAPSRPFGDPAVYSQIYLIAIKQFRWNNKVGLNLAKRCGFFCAKYIG